MSALEAPTRPPPPSFSHKKQGNSKGYSVDLESMDFNDSSQPDVRKRSMTLESRPSRNKTSVDTQNKESHVIDSRMIQKQMSNPHIIDSRTSNNGSSVPVSKPDRPPPPRRLNASSPTTSKTQPPGEGGTSDEPPVLHRGPSSDDNSQSVKRSRESSPLPQLVEDVVANGVSPLPNATPTPPSRIVTPPPTAPPPTVPRRQHSVSTPPPTSPSSPTSPSPSSSPPICTPPSPSPPTSSSPTSCSPVFSPPTSTTPVEGSVDDVYPDAVTSSGTNGNSSPDDVIPTAENEGDNSTPVVPARPYRPPRPFAPPSNQAEKKSGHRRGSAPTQSHHRTGVTLAPKSKTVRHDKSPRSHGKSRDKVPHKRSDREECQVKPVSPTQGDVTSPTQGDVTSPTQGDVTSPTQTSPTQGDVTSPTQGSVTSPTQGSVTSPTQGSVTSPTQGSVTSPSHREVGSPLHKQVIMKSVESNAQPPPPQPSSPVLVVTNETTVFWEEGSESHADQSTLPMSPQHLSSPAEEAESNSPPVQSRKKRVSFSEDKEEEKDDVVAPLQPLSSPKKGGWKLMTSVKKFSKSFHSNRKKHPEVVTRSRVASDAGHLTNNYPDPLPGGCIHPLVVQCVAYLNRECVLDEQGLFRIPGDLATVRRLRQEFMQGYEVDLMEVLDPHTVACLLKLHFRELKCSIIPRGPTLNNVMTNVKNLDVDGVKSELENLEELSLSTLSLVIELMAKISSHSHKNLMTSGILATSSGPSIFPYLPPSNANQITKFLIDNSSTVFP